MRRTPTKPPSCFAARTAVIALRKKSERGVIPKRYKLVFPASWSKSQLLAYCRAVHVDETVRLIEWHESHIGWEPKLFMTNPAAFSDYRKGKLN